MVASLLLVGIIGIATVAFINTNRFGKHPSGERLSVIENSPNYANGVFKNLMETPVLTEGVSYSSVLTEFLFSSKPKEPKDSIPSVKTDLKSLEPDQNVMIWMGHSSYFLQIDGKTILVDPVLSGHASPFSFTTKAYKGTDIYSTEEIPDIDYLFISHDHWDHMDVKTLKSLQPRIGKVITGLGNGAHLESWGFNPDQILEGDWYDSIELDSGIVAHVAPTRHFSGRGFKRAKTLWASFVYSSHGKQYYFGGDSGYGTHFKEIGERYGPIDLAVLENGQYDENWKYIHMLPGEQFTAASDLNAHTIFPVHSGKFTLANHSWDEPFRKITELSKQHNQRVITPKIGEVVDLSDRSQLFEEWWKSVN